LFLGGHPFEDFLVAVLFLMLILHMLTFVQVKFEYEEQA
jgi:hypothetical protein